MMHRVCTGRGRLRRLRAALVGAAVALLSGPVAAGERADFRLELDTGGHRGIVRALATDAAGRWLISASDDKTVRVWDLDTGRSAATLRGQIGEGEQGMVFAAVPSADAAAVAVGGYFAPVGAADGFGAIRIHDRRTGRLTHRLEGRRLPVFALAYDPVRDELAAVGQGHELHRWRAPFSEAPEPLPALDADAQRMDRVLWAAGGRRLVAVTADYGLRLWDADSAAPIVPDDAPSLWDAALTGLAVSPDGARIALGGGAGLVQVRDAEDGRLLADLPPVPFRPDALAFLPGDRLAIGCGHGCRPGMAARVVHWPSGAVVAGYDALEGLASAALALPDGRVALAGGWRHEIHLWDPGADGPAQVLAGTGAPVLAVALEPEGGGIAWGTAHPCPEEVVCPETFGALERQLPLPQGERRLSVPAAAGPETDLWNRARHTAKPWALRAVSDGRFETAVLQVTGPDGLRPLFKRGGTDGYYNAAFSLLPEAGALVTGGGNGFLGLHRLEDLALTRVLEGHSAEVGALAASEAAGRLLTGSTDQTLKLWNLETGELIASFFFTDDDWIVWTPQGYYHASPEGDRLIGWHINQGDDREGRFMRSYQLKRHLHSPEIVERAIRLGSARAAALELRGADDDLGRLLARPAPEFEMRLVEDAAVEPGFAVIEVMEGPGAAEAALSVLVNDRRVAAQPIPGAGPGAQRYIVAVEEGANDIVVTAEDDAGYITARGAVAMARLPEAGAPAGRLRVAVVGIQDYPLLPEGCGGRSCDLAYPLPDAVEFLAALSRYSAPLYSEMEVLVMLNEGALERSPALRAQLARHVDPAAVIEPDARSVTFELMEFLEEAQDPADTTVVFVAGHGIVLGEDYFLIPSDGRQRAPDRWQMASLVDWRSIQSALERAQGRRILVLDTCHAAGAFNQRLEKDAADARISVFAATGPSELAGESARLGHGIFTWAMIEGMRGAARTADGVWALGLAEFVSHEVRRLSGQVQEPMFHFPQMRNFLIARP